MERTERQQRVLRAPAFHALPLGQASDRTHGTVFKTIACRSVLAIGVNYFYIVASEDLPVRWRFGQISCIQDMLIRLYQARRTCGFCIWQTLTPLQAPDITDYLASGSFAEHGMSVCLGHVQR